MKPIMMQALCVISLILAGHVSNSHAHQNMKLEKLERAVQNGAKCLDGSPPAYYFQKGNDKGSSKWIVHLMGGAWCFLKKDNHILPRVHIPKWVNCYDRSNITWNEYGTIGTTKNLTEKLNQTIGGILSDDKETNPYFYNWNHVFVVYCDGFSFAGDSDMTVRVHRKEVTVYSRGRKILLAVLDHLVNEKGMAGTGITDFLLTGCSAGGLATYIHADFVRSHLIKSTKTNFKYKALADSGYFLDVGHLKTFWHSYKTMMGKGYEIHNPVESLNQQCLKDNKHILYSDEKMCLFVQHFFDYIDTPVFTVNSINDAIQLTGIRGLNCTLSPSQDFCSVDTCSKSCSPKEMEQFYNFGKTFLDHAKPILRSESSGVFLHSCPTPHCQTIYDEPWSTIKIKLNGRDHLMSKTVADWYEDVDGEGNYKVVDVKKWPNNPTCPIAKKQYSTFEPMTWFPEEL